VKNTLDDLKNMLDTGTRCIWIQTSDEGKTICDVHKALQEQMRGEFNMFEWSYALGLRQLKMKASDAESLYDPQYADIVTLFYKIATDAGKIPDPRRESDEYSNNIYILRDFASAMEDNAKKITSYISDVFGDYEKEKSKTIVIALSPAVSIPPTLTGIFKTIKEELPDIDEIKTMINDVIVRLPQFNNESGKDVQTDYTEDEIAMAAVNLCGLTRTDIKRIMRESIGRLNKLDVEFFGSIKQDNIMKTGMLKYRQPRMKLDDVGGNDNVKKMLRETIDEMAPEAVEWGLSGKNARKGYLAVGIPGCGKTLLAEAFAGELGIPLIEFDLSKVMDRFVGETEKNTQKILSMIRASAPCVLLLDEVEKTFNGCASSANVDAGTLERVMGEFLKLMDEDNGIFIVMTSNDHTRLPVEFTRKERLDQTFFFDVPTEEERRKIFEIHSKEYKKANITANIIDAGVKATVGYTGAEIKGIIKDYVRKLFHHRDSLDKHDEEFFMNVMRNACKETTPVTVSSKERINNLVTWCTAHNIKKAGSSKMRAKNYSSANILNIGNR